MLIIPSIKNDFFLLRIHHVGSEVNKMFIILDNSLLQFKNRTLTFCQNPDQVENITNKILCHDTISYESVRYKINGEAGENKEQAVTTLLLDSYKHCSQPVGCLYQLALGWLIQWLIKNFLASLRKV